MHHHHDHAHEGDGPRLLFALVIVVTITLAEIIGSFVSGSLALFSDAGHMLMDAFAIVLGLMAIHLGAKPPNRRYTYGFRRLEPLAAFVNYLLLIGVTIFIVVQAIARIATPSSVHASMMTWVAVLGLVGNLVMLWILRHRHGSMNMKAVRSHIFADTISSVGVVIGGWLIAETGWVLIDPIISIGIAVLILASVIRGLKQTVHVLLDGVPEGVDLTRIVNQISLMRGVRSVDDIHCTNNGRLILTAHVGIHPMTREQEVFLRDEIGALLHSRYGIGHCTIEFDPERIEDNPRHRRDHCALAAA